MKKIKTYILPLSLIFLFGLFSCNDTHEFHEEYIKDGEIIYATKADSLRTLSGDGRLKIAGYLTKGFTVQEIKAFWDKGESSQTFAYSKSENDTDALDLIITGLEEKSYEFDVYTIDEDGNESIKVTVFGTVYGEIFRSNLESREFNSFTYNSDNSATIDLKPISDLTRATEIKYTNLSNEETLVTAMHDESEATLEQADISAPIMYRTYYVPSAADDDGNETSIDEFDSDWKTYVFPSNISTVIGTITVDPATGGAIANWENSENELFTFVFKNLNKQGDEVINTLDSSEPMGTYTFSGMGSGEQTVEITISDVYGNSQSISFTLTPLSAPGKGSWTIVDFSTEEAGGEGPVNGYATAAIDGDTGTFWHSNWSGAGSSFPHHLTIDMGEERNIAGFEVYTRSGDNRGATDHEFWVSSDNVTYTMIATLNAAIDVNNGALVNVDEITTARYVRYVATAGPNSFTFLGELNVIESLDNSDWSVVDFSTEEDGGEGPVNGYATAAIDGDTGTFWHSNWSGAGSSFPHHLTIDLGAEKGITGFEVYTRSGDNRGATTHEFWVSSDNVTFTQVATLNEAIDVNNGALVNTGVITTGRYVRYVATAGPNSFTFLGEIRVFGLIE